MELSRPLAVITPTIDGDVLRVLAMARGEFTSGEIHRLLKGPSIRGILNTLGRLTDQGIVTRRPAGRANLYALNRAHLAAPHIIAMAQLRDELLDRLAAEVESWWIPPIVAALFGPGAGRDHSALSDIDILLVRGDEIDGEVWGAQVESMEARVKGWTGNDCRTLTMTASHVRSHGRDEPVLGDALRGGLAFNGDVRLLKSAVKGRD